ncbi:MAG: LysR family transcriptional regulator [Firmicutes bacterium]|jgi:DNA-binding transcriptional LysR family regulator|nr:LysR family transcriptional regulator [Bacillota bacterium]
MLKHLSQMGLYVLKVAIEAGTFRAAAQQLNISQPAVSAHIHRIERDLEVELFERPYGRKLQLTDAGRVVYTYALEILAKNEELHKAATELRSGELGQIKLAFSVGKFIIPSMLAAFRKKYPEISFILRTGNSARIQKLVLNGEADFGLSLFSDNPQIEFRPFYREPLIMVCSPDHPVASQKVVQKEDLDKYGLLSGLSGSDYNRFVFNGFAAIGFHNLRIVAQVEEPEIVLKIVEEGGGISLLLQSAAQTALERGYIVELSFGSNVKLPTMDVYLLFRKGAHLSTAVNRFIDFLQAEISERFPFITII